MKLTRRDLIRFGAGASVVALGGPWGSLLAGSEDLIEVTIPSSGRKVPAVGIGTIYPRGGTISDGKTIINAIYLHRTSLFSRVRRE